jgi:hypothetical protein
MQRTLADIVLVIHLIWIIFMLYGFVLTVRAFWRPAFWDRWLFRTIHLAGIVFVASLELLHKYCPLTIWENALRQPGQSGSEAPNYFIMGYIERLVYPDVSPLVYLLPTYGIALFTLVMFLVKRPAKFRCRSGGLPS